MQTVSTHARLHVAAPTARPTLGSHGHHHTGQSHTDKANPAPAHRQATLLHIGMPCSQYQRCRRASKVSNTVYNPETRPACSRKGVHGCVTPLTLGAVIANLIVLLEPGA